MRRFAASVLRFVKTLPTDPAGTAVARQLARSGTGISSNYHAACRGRSRDEFIAKLGVALEEADETEHWLALLVDAGLTDGASLAPLRHEAAELRAILRQSVVTARRNHPKRRHVG